MGSNGTLWHNRIVGHGEEDPAKIAAHPRNWLTALVDQVAGDPSSTTLRTQLAHAYSYVQAQAEHFAHDTELGKNLKASIKDILKPEDSEDDE